MSNIKENELLKGLNVSHACAKDDTRPILQGVNFKSNHICALDGYRISIRELENLNIENEITINSKEVKALKNILDKKSDHEVKIEESEKDIIFESEGMELKLHNHNENYVRYEMLIPQTLLMNMKLIKKNY